MPESFEERIQVLEARFAEAENQGGEGEGSGGRGGPSFHASEAMMGMRHTAHTAPTEMSDDSQDQASALTMLTNANTIPAVRECSFVQFKNRFSSEEGRYAVDVLLSGPLLDQEISMEQRLRERRSESRKVLSREMQKKETAYIKGQNKRDQYAMGSVQSKDVWIQKIRIQSPALILMLSKIQGEPWTNRPRTYERPFLSLVHYHKDMKKILDELEVQWGAVVDHPGHPDHSDGVDHPDHPDATPRPHAAAHETQHAASEQHYDCPEALLILRAYVRYFDEHVLPATTQFLDKDFSTQTEVRFSDLWYLFRVGELLYRPPEGGLMRQRDFRTAKRVWRSYGLRPADAQFRLPPKGQQKYKRKEDEDEMRTVFLVRAFYLEYNGEEFCPFPYIFKIPPYEGTVPVTSLRIFPLRFAPDWQALRQSCMQTGDKIKEYMDRRHASYSGWTVTRTPFGDAMPDASGSAIQHAEHINSTVMIDFAETFQSCPAWKPHRVILRPEPPFQQVEPHEFPVIWWKDRDRTKALAEMTEMIPVATGVSTFRQNEFLTTDPLLSRMIDNDNRGQLTTRDYIVGEDRALISDRVYGYVFQERKFAALDVQRLWRPSESHEALDALRIPAETKDMLLSAVRGHLMQKSTGRAEEEQHCGLDLIHGKGAGLFILLYGMPGVGKTATSEAIAQACSKPLFKITCGDLGLTPDRVESTLKDIFRLAGVWDCILLLDEVDTFFSARSKGDSAMHKNALVAVFLSIMDYYTGILFLTTNLVGALDEAFKSRIHCKINYPALTKLQTREIWQNNLLRLRQLDEEHCRRENRKPLEIPETDIIRFAESQFDYLNSQRHKHGSNRTKVHGWNGRQIRNACQVAYSLAYCDAMKLAADEQRHRHHHEGSGGGSGSGVALPTPRPAPRLEVRHFKTLHDINLSFDNYMVDVHGGFTAGDLARESELRADDYDDPFTSRRRVQENYEGYGDDNFHFHARTDLQAPVPVPVPVPVPLPSSSQSRPIFGSGRLGSSGSGNMLGLGRAGGADAGLSSASPHHQPYLPNYGPGVRRGSFGRQDSPGTLSGRASGRQMSGSFQMSPRMQDEAPPSRQLDVGAGNGPGSGLGLGSGSGLGSQYYFNRPREFGNDPVFQEDRNLFGKRERQEDESGM